MDCPFCGLDPKALIFESPLVVAFRDRFPVSPGHTLVITKRHVETYFDATDQERAALWDAVDAVRHELNKQTPAPDGFNVGTNAGTAAGQTVMHMHLHVIPRYTGDMDDPRGGVRGVIPSKQKYGDPKSTAAQREDKKARSLSTGGDDDPFIAHLHPLFAHATDIAIVAAFVQLSGLERLRTPLVNAVRRGARVRVLTGDYLHITQSDALTALLDLVGSLTTTELTDTLSHPANDCAVDRSVGPGQLSVRVIETEALAAKSRSFHPKSWRFEGPQHAVAFVGSSNMSRSALEHGIEWNLRLDRAQDPLAWARLCTAFESLWSHPAARELTPAFVERYRAQALALSPAANDSPPLGEVELELEDRPEVPAPHQVQREGLVALAQSRASGHPRALVVMATGLGKTWLAAMDILQFARELGRVPRVLFVAHRTEILAQTARVFRALISQHFTSSTLRWFDGDPEALQAPFVLASVALMARKEHLEKLPSPSHFDYVVVDEVHHATASSYRKILDKLTPRFLLGLTATPDRSDEADVAGLFDDHIAFRADLDRGIQVGRLVGFAYFGVCDTLEYKNIPWRSWSAAELTLRVETQARMEQLWRAWVTHIGTRTLVFCCSVSHADYVLSWLRERDPKLRALAVHSGPTSADRTMALDALRDGTLDVLCTVDMFNEGVDLPAVDRVVMLRPTASPVVFMQQLGRGLRISGGKTSLTVIDFVGNDRVFLDRLRRLVSFASSDPSREIVAALDATGPYELPLGCSIELELEAKDVLRKLNARTATTGIECERVFRELLAQRGERPRAGELLRMGYSVESLRGRYESWFDFVSKVGGFSQDGAEEAVFAVAARWLREVEVTKMTKCFKMIVLEALIEADALRTGMTLEDLARRSYAVLRRSPELFATIEQAERFASIEDPKIFKLWMSYWKSNPVDAWTSPKGSSSAFFRIEAGRLVPQMSPTPGRDGVLAAMTRELVDLRLTSQRWRTSTDSMAEFFCKVTWNKRDPILKLPTKRANVPEKAPLDVRLPDGGVMTFHPQSEFINVATSASTTRNQLPDLLRKWFGPAAGQPGTKREVHFWRVGEAWHVQPVAVNTFASEAANGGDLLSFASYPELRVAAGIAEGASEPPEQERVSLRTTERTPDMFAVRATGSSMDGGKSPIQDGDWLLFRWARSAPISSVKGRVALVETPSPTSGSRYQVKRVTEQEGRWWLQSDNATVERIAATESTTVLALLVESIAPKSLAPSVRTELGEDDIAEAFGLGHVECTTGRYEGHLFVFVSKKGVFAAPDELSVPAVVPRPGETAFVLAKVAAGRWSYCGVASAMDGGPRWRIGALDHATWKLLGDGRSTSKRLPEGYLDRAREFATRALLHGAGHVFRWDERAIRLLGASKSGGLRIDGAEGGFEERTVSLTDLAWVWVAVDDVAREGGLLDLARVHRLRYLSGTPEASTRFIDTRWAIALVQLDFDGAKGE